MTRRSAGGSATCSTWSASATSPRRRPSQLSGGQQQRVALARALVNLPSALLLDEPLAALDLKLRQAMQIELKRIQREVGITFVFVTHDQEEALTMSDRIAVMSQGNVEQIGTPTEIYNSPDSIFVAGFIGSANLLPGVVSGVDGERAMVRLHCGPTVPVAGCPVTTGQSVTVMLRPERLAVSQHEPDTSEQGVRPDHQRHLPRRRAPPRTGACPTAPNWCCTSRPARSWPGSAPATSCGRRGRPTPRT